MFKKLGDCSQGIDPYSHKLEITLDLICLTQPSEPDEGDEWKVSKDVKLLRQDSNESFYSSQGHQSPEQGSNSLCSQDEKFVLIIIFYPSKLICSWHFWGEVFLNPFSANFS